MKAAVGFKEVDLELNVHVKELGGNGEKPFPDAGWPLKKAHMYPKKKAAWDVCPQWASVLGPCQPKKQQPREDQGTPGMTESFLSISPP